MNSDRATSSEPGLSDRDQLKQLCDKIVDRRMDEMKKDAHPRPQQLPRASAIGDCAREMFYQIAAWQQRPAWDPWLMMRFERGRDIEERIVMPRLAEYGFRVVAGQLALTIEGRKGQVICTGHIDGRLHWHDIEPVFDVKSLNPNLFERLREVSDLLGNRWVTKWVTQLLLYMYAHNEVTGFFLIDDCLGHWRAIPVHLNDHLDLCEAALTKCEQVTDAIEVGEPPPYHQDAAVCRDCWAFQSGVCQPPLDLSDEAIKLLQDEQTLEILERMNQLRSDGEEYAALDRKLKELQKKRGVGRYLCGQFLVETSSSSRRAYDVPDEVKEKYATTTEAIKTSWRKLGGGSFGD